MSGPGPLLGTLDSLGAYSGVNEAGDGFVTVRIEGEVDGRPVVLVGQLDPERTGGVGTDFHAAAEAARQDGATLRTIRRLDLPIELAGRIVAELRRTREEE